MKPLMPPPQRFLIRASDRRTDRWECTIQKDGLEEGGAGRGGRSHPVNRPILPHVGHERSRRLGDLMLLAGVDAQAILVGDEGCPFAFSIQDRRVAAQDRHRIGACSLAAHAGQRITGERATSSGLADMLALRVAEERCVVEQSFGSFIDISRKHCSARALVHAGTCAVGAANHVTI